MTWLRRGREYDPSESAAATPAPGAQEIENSPQALRWHLWQLDRFLNASAGQLPLSATVTARRITDVLRDVVDTSALNSLDIYAVVSIQGIVGDYLPTTVRSYLALDPATRSAARPSGTTPAASLDDQLEALLGASLAVLAGAQDQDADALLTQGSFLRTKFSGSDLDL